MGSKNRGEIWDIIKYQVLSRSEGRRDKMSGFGQQKDDESGVGRFPAEVVERLEAYAERVGISLEESKERFVRYCEDEFEADMDDVLSEEDWAIDLSESFFLSSRTQRASSAQGTKLVGMFVGAEGRVGDRNQGLKKAAISRFEEDPVAAIESGWIGRYKWLDDEDRWVVHTKAAVVDATGSREEPDFGFRCNGDWLCLLGGGKPRPASNNGRYYLFIGNTEDMFESDIRLLKIDSKGADLDVELRYREPCVVNVNAQRDNLPAFLHNVFETRIGWADNIEYTDTFVGEELRHLLKPEKFLKNKQMHDYYVELADLVDAYHKGKETSSTGKQYGPTVITSGTVVRHNAEAREGSAGDYYLVALSSAALEHQLGDGLQSEVPVFIDEQVVNLTDSFHAPFKDGMGRWAEQSRVFVCGQISVNVRDGREEARINGTSIMGIEGRCRRWRDGGNTDLSQFE